MFDIIPSKIICLIPLWKLHGFSNIMSKPNVKTHVTNTKVYLRPPDFFFIS